MGEIKSALELAMERSRKYAVSSEEREKIKEKEILQKATGLFHRYKESHLPLHEIAREFDRMDDKARERVRASLLSQCVDSVSFEEDPERIFVLMESIKGRDLHHLREEFQNLLTAYREEVNKAKQKMGLQLAEDLRRAGIHGDAVIPNVEGNDRWKEILDSLDHSYRGKLEKIREALRK